MENGAVKVEIGKAFEQMKPYVKSVVDGQVAQQEVRLSNIGGSCEAVHQRQRTAATAATVTKAFTWRFMPIATCMPLMHPEHGSLTASLTTC